MIKENNVKTSEEEEVFNRTPLSKSYYPEGISEDADK